LAVVRVLVVDYSLFFRRFVRRILETKQDFQLVGEAADGFEAVRQATQLKPDLILLDIDLPRLDGIQAAKTILSAVPRSKIVFVTAHCSLSLAGTALNLGAKGYVVKSEAANDLLRATEVVRSNKQFVSKSVVGYESS
jgi:NarL family two-component system response regulator LiaR